MNSDQELSTEVKRLHEIARSHSNGEYDDELIEEALTIVNSVFNYAHKMSNERSVQLRQIENNVSDIRRVLNQPPVEGHYPKVAHYIDNLVTYCGAQM